MLGTKAHSESYAYSDSEGTDGTITTTATVFVYTYDTAGNICSETKTTGGTATTKSYTYGDGLWKDLLTKVGSTYITYDDSGNPLNWYNGKKTFSGLRWEQGRQLARLSVGGTDIHYEYDADGIRTKMSAGSTTYEYITQGGKLMRETATKGSTVYVMDFIYDNAGRPFSVKFSKNGGSSFTTYYYVLNLQGDVVKIIKADGTVMATYTYDAWGNLVSLINASGNDIVNSTAGTAIAFWNPLTYRGYIRDRETGFYYLQSRYYDPANHRFINADGLASTGQGFIGTNMFAYCNNNSVSYFDNTGRSLRPTTVTICDGGTRPEADKVLMAGEAMSMSFYGDTIIIDAYIEFSGPVDSSVMLDGIAEYWNGYYSLLLKGEVLVVVDIHIGKSSNGKSIMVTSYDEKGRSYTRGHRTIGGDIGITIFSMNESGAKERVDWVIAHEFGHCLGVGDYYSFVEHNIAGYDKQFPSIMNSFGMHASVFDIMKVITVFNTGTFQTWGDEVWSK